jgi:integrase/recombinase XerD
MGAPSKHKIYSENYQTEAKNYKKHLDILGLNPQTTQNRYLFLKGFLSYLEIIKVCSFKDITPKNIIDYKSYLTSKINQQTGQLITPKSVYERLRTVQQFLGFLLENCILESNPASAFKWPYPNQKPSRFIFSQDQIKALYKLANQQEKMILNIGYGCGLRVQEMSDLNKEDIRLLEKIIVVEKGKNNKRRLVPISQKISDEISPLAPEGGTNAVFLNNKGRRMQEWGFNARLKQLILKTDFGQKLTSEELNKIGIHSLRHSIATHLLENGMKLEQVQKFLGHSNIESTEIYTHITQNQINKMK